MLGASLIGYLGGKVALEKFDVIKQRNVNEAAEEGYVITDAVAQQRRPSHRYALRVLVIGSACWFVPVVVLWLSLGREHVFTQEAIFFSQSAVVTFGGAYAVLAYIAQQAVEVFGWLQPGEMLDGLGMAETTPGPLIQVVQFVGYMGAYRNAGSLSPTTAGIIGSVITTWVTFVPCFLWILLGAPFIEYWRGNKALTTALSGITAAVVGVVLNLGIWFAIQTLFGVVDERHFGPLRLFVPDFRTLDVVALLISISAFIALLRFKISMLWTLAFSAGAGMIWFLLFQ